MADPLRILFNADGTVLATAFANGELMFLDVKERKEIARFHGHDGRILRIQWDPDAEDFVTCSDDGVVRWWSADNLDGVPTLELAPFGGDRVVDFAVHQTNGRIALLGEDRAESIGLPSRTGLDALRYDFESEGEARTFCVTFLGEMLLVGRTSGYLYALNPDLTYDAHASIFGHGKISSIGAHPEGACFIAGGGRGAMAAGVLGTIHPHGARDESETYKTAMRWREPPKPIAVNGIAFKSDGTEFAAACSDRTVRVVNWEERSILASNYGRAFYHESPNPGWNRTFIVADVVYAPDGLMASVHFDGNIRLWETKHDPVVIPHSPA